MPYSALSVASAAPPAARHQHVAFRLVPKAQSLNKPLSSQGNNRFAYSLLSDRLSPRRSLLLRSAEPEEASTAESKPAAEPKVCKEAINAGLELYRSKQYKEAITMWQKSLEMPGSGAMRMSGTVREFSCPSEGEENAALYNMACAYSQLKETQSAVTCIQGALENGFDDFQTLRKDPDLANIQGGALEEVIGKFEKPLDKINAIFGRDKKQKDSGTNKPWLLW